MVVFSRLSLFPPTVGALTLIQGSAFIISYLGLSDDGESPV